MFLWPLKSKCENIVLKRKIDQSLVIEVEPLNYTSWLLFLNQMYYVEGAINLYALCDVRNYSERSVTQTD